MDPAILKGRPMCNAILGWVMTGLIAVGAMEFLAGAGLASAPLLTALALTTTSLGTLLPILRDGGLLAPPYGPMVLAAGAMGEAAPVAALSLVLAGSGHAASQAMILVLFGIGSAVAVYLAARSRSSPLAPLIARTMPSAGQFPLRLAICVLILLVVLARELSIDLVLGAFIAGALLRAALPEQHHGAASARLDGLGYALLVPIFFFISGTRLDIVSLIADPVALIMVPVYAALMLAARGLPALILYRADLDLPQRLGLALHSATQLSLVVAIAGIASARGLMPGSQAGALVGGAIVTVLAYPALARRFVGKAGEAA